MASSHSGFSAAALDKKFKSLNSTLQSIQGTAQWIIQHRKNAKTVVGQWYKELQEGVRSKVAVIRLLLIWTRFFSSVVDTKKKLTLLYLANDIIQSCKKKGPEFKVEFAKVLPRAFQLVSREKDESLCKSVERIISVWEERKVFESDVILRLKSLLGNAIAGVLWRVCFVRNTPNWVSNTSFFHVNTMPLFLHVNTLSLSMPCLYFSVSMSYVLLLVNAMIMLAVARRQLFYRLGNFVLCLPGHIADNIVETIS